jgi:hypothetical protein
VTILEQQCLFFALLDETKLYLLNEIQSSLQRPLSLKMIGNDSGKRIKQYQQYQQKLKKKKKKKKK